MKLLAVRIVRYMFCVQRLSLAVLLVLGAALPAAHAFKLSPMKMTLSPQGRGASGVFTVTNEGNETLAVDVHFLSRSLSLDGKEVNERADKQFMVFPPQFVLAGGGEQIVRVKWIGKSPVEKELAFRLVAEQLPVRLTKEAGGGVNLNVGIRYLASVYVQPGGTKEKVVSRTEVVNGEATKSLQLDVCNEGSRHVILKDLVVELSCGGSSVKLPQELVAKIDGENLLAGSTRRLRMPWPQGLPFGEPVAHVKYRE